MLGIVHDTWSGSATSGTAAERSVGRDDVRSPRAAALAHRKKVPVHRLVFVESSCLVDTWSMLTGLVRAARRDSGGRAAIGALEAEAARGTDLTAVHRALWDLLGGYDYSDLSTLAGTPACGGADRVDALGRSAARAVRWHRRVGDTIIVVSDLMPLFAGPLVEHLRVDRVVCGAPPVDPAGRLAGGYPDILLGPAAGAAAQRVAAQESVPLADCVAYGREPRDNDLLETVGNAVRIGYDGALRTTSHRTTPRPATSSPFPVWSRSESA